VRRALGLRGRGMQLIAKIENAEGLRNIDEIIEESDAVMIARGDLGMEIPPEKVFIAQKRIISKCNLKGKPVITATQMLNSMTKSPRPTRAEATDVANAVLDGTDSVLLTAETANGAFPERSVTVMRRICEEAEAVIDYQSLYLNMNLGVMRFSQNMMTMESLCSSAVKATLDAGCPLLIALTETGHTPKLIAKYRPKATILALSSNEGTLRHLLCVRGVVTLLTSTFVGIDVVIHHALHHAKGQGMVQSGDVIVAIHGQHAENLGGANVMKMMDVP